MLHIYNSLTRKKEIFTPIEPGKVKMYVCGMTVYDLCHLGHARVLVVFDTVTRFLRHSGYQVHYVRNITDIDDKIIARANENGEDFNALTGRFIQAMHEDAAELGVLPPDEEPAATASMAGIISMIETLIEKGHAYAADNGDVYYDVSSFENYGRLSGKRLEDLRAGERVAVDRNKDDPLDFVLWKASKPDEPFWDSPWGKGRPGWHIECSVMSTCCLGNHFDIHGGGQDLQFPHHENEIAQSEAATGEKFVNLWMHNGFVRINDEKMSKSLGNFFTVREILKLYQGEEIRYFVLASHYRSPLNYSDQLLDSARSSLTRLYNALRGLELPSVQVGEDGTETRFNSAMEDDFNTSEAIAVLFDLAGQVNRLREIDPGKAVRKAALLKKLGNVLGLLEADPEAYLQGSAGEAVDVVRIEALIQQRLDARANKDWAEADRIRDELNALGIELEDKAGSTSWRRA
ncbi:MAG: cysteine--tRNA ligase [Gammaproteobacteria bacterium]|jgi:cysteinyl-tRNA synthetase|nr:cysteine--tRNA ligase [Gammaproteobacteria bacterium]